MFRVLFFVIKNSIWAVSFTDHALQCSPQQTTTFAICIVCLYFSQRGNALSFSQAVPRCCGARACARCVRVPVPCLLSRTPRAATLWLIPPQNG